MRVTVAEDNRLVVTDEETFWSPGPGAEVYRHYLDVFEEVAILGRVASAASVPQGYRRVDAERIRVVPLPNYQGPTQYLFRRRAFVRAVRGAARESLLNGDAFILRDSQVAHVLAPLLYARNYPFAVAVIADPRDIFAPGAFEHPLRPFFRWWFTRRLKMLCRHADALTYVTAEALQHRYPGGPGTISQHFSDVQLEVFAERPRTAADFRKTEFRLCFAGAVNRLIKAPDVLIKAFAHCVRAGWDLRLVMLGDGRLRPELQRLAHSEGVGDRVELPGHVSPPEVFGRLRESDLFLLPSRTEGLPRALLEAMALALPCIGADVGGIPELLPPNDRVCPGDVDALAGKIIEVLQSPERMAEMSARNLIKAREYASEVLAEKRTNFYRAVRELTQRHLGLIGHCTGTAALPAGPVEAAGNAFDAKEFSATRKEGA